MGTEVHYVGCGSKMHRPVVNFDRGRTHDFYGGGGLSQHDQQGPKGRNLRSEGCKVLG